MLSGLIVRTRVRYMNHILHKQIYAGLFEIIKDKNCYYHSSVGRDYSHLTDEGKEALVKWIDAMAYEMIELEEKQLDARAKKLMWDELKK
jgi:hypothetical protein